MGRFHYFSLSPLSPDLRDAQGMKGLFFSPPNKVFGGSTKLQQREHEKGNKVIELLSMFEYQYGLV